MKVDHAVKYIRKRFGLEFFKIFVKDYLPLRQNPEYAYWKLGFRFRKGKRVKIIHKKGYTWEKIQQTLQVKPDGLKFTTPGYTASKAWPVPIWYNPTTKQVFETLTEIYASVTNKKLIRYLKSLLVKQGRRWFYTNRSIRDELHTLPESEIREISEKIKIT